MREHIAQVHEGKKFKCHKCDVELKSSQGLKWHLEIHDRPILGL